MPTIRKYKGAMKTYGVIKGEWLILEIRERFFEEKNTSILYTDGK